MGGPVSVVIRRQSGEVTPMTFYTDMVMMQLLKPAVLRGEDAAIDEVVAYWRDAGRRYAQSATPGMDPNWLAQQLYSSEPILAPRGYGIVILDLLSKKLFDMQDFSNLDTFMVPNVKCGPGFADPSDRYQSMHDYHLKQGWIESYKVAVKGEVAPLLEREGFRKTNGHFYVFSPDQIETFNNIMGSVRARSVNDALSGVDVSATAPAAPVVAALVDLEEYNRGRIQDPCLLANATTNLGGIEYHKFAQEACDAKELLGWLSLLDFETTPAIRSIWRDWIDMKERLAFEFNDRADDDALSLN